MRNLGEKFFTKYTKKLLALYKNNDIIFIHIFGGIMPTIRPSADLRNNYNEISELCHEYSEPVFINQLNILNYQ
jgi:hypothetical protein